MRSESVSCSVRFNSLWPDGLWPARLLCPWNSPDKNTGVGGQALLQGIFLTQGSNLGLPHCRQILYHLSHQQSPSWGRASEKTMLWWFQVDRKDTQPHIYMYPFSPKWPFHPGCHIVLSRVPVLYSGSLLVIHFKYTSVYMSIPNSLTIPSPHPPPPPATISSISKSVTDKPKLRDILQDTWPLLFRNVKGMKDKESLRNCHRQEITKEVTQTGCY